MVASPMKVKNAAAVKALDGLKAVKKHSVTNKAVSAVETKKDVVEPEETFPTTEWYEEQTTSRVFLGMYRIYNHKIELKSLPMYARALVDDICRQCGVMEIYAYLICVLLIVVGYHIVSDGFFSCVVTLGSVVQLLGLVLNLLRINESNSFGSVSVKSLQLYVPVYLMRLAATIHDKGYRPIDSTGQWAYQVADFAAFLVVLVLLAKAYKNPTVQKETFPVFWTTFGCLMFALVVHPCQNLGTWSDVSWTASLYLETFVMLPQLTLMSKMKSVESLTSHAVACTEIYRLCNLGFWIFSRRELMRIKCPTFLPSWCVIAALVIQVLLPLDFFLCYAHSLITNAAVQIPAFMSTV